VCIKIRELLRFLLDPSAYIFGWKEVVKVGEKFIYEGEIFESE